MPPRVNYSGPTPHFMRAWRLSKKMTLAQLGDIVGSKKSNLSLIENGRTGMTAAMADAVAQALGISVDTLRNRPPGEAVDSETELLEVFRSLSAKGKQAALTSIRAIAALDRGE